MKNGSKLYYRLAPCLFVSFSRLHLASKAKDWNLEEEEEEEWERCAYGD